MHMWPQGTKDCHGTAREAFRPRCAFAAHWQRILRSSGRGSAWVQPDLGERLRGRRAQSIPHAGWSRRPCRSHRRRSRLHRGQREATVESIRIRGYTIHLRIRGYTIHLRIRGFTIHLRIRGYTIHLFLRAGLVNFLLHPTFSALATLPSTDVHTISVCCTWQGNHRVCVYINQGSFLYKFGPSRGSAPGQFIQPWGIAILGRGQGARILTTEWQGKRVQVAM